MPEFEDGHNRVTFPRDVEGGMDEDLMLPDINATIAATMRAAAGQQTAESANGLVGLDFSALDTGLEHALDELREREVRLSGLHDGVVEALEVATQNYEEELQSLPREMGELSAKHESMGERYRRVGWRAKQIGGELTIAESQRQRANESLDLLRELNTLTALPAVKQRIKASRARAAELNNQTMTTANGRGKSPKSAVSSATSSQGAGGRDAVTLDIQKHLPAVAGGGLATDGMEIIRDVLAKEMGASNAMRALALRLRALHDLTSGLEERHPDQEACALVVQLACQLSEEALLSRFEHEWQRLSLSDFVDLAPCDEGALTTGSAEGATRGESQADSGQLFLRSIALQPYGVLGQALTASSGRVVTTGVKPEAVTGGCCIVDPAGLHHIQPPGGPSGAGGAAGSIYKWLGIDKSRSFPQDVIDIVAAPGDAAYHAYFFSSPSVASPDTSSSQSAAGSSHMAHVIHAVGPDLRKPPPGSSKGELYTRAQAAEALAQTYANIFEAFANHCAMPTTTSDAIAAAQEVPDNVSCRVLRLLPVSGGIFSGPFLSELPELTAETIVKGFEMLPHAAQKQALLQSEVHLCVFADNEVPLFEGVGISFPSSDTETARAALVAKITSDAESAASSSEAMPTSDLRLATEQSSASSVPPSSSFSSPLTGWTSEAALRLRFLEEIAATLELYPTTGRPLQRRFVYWALNSISSAAAVDVSAADDDAVAALSALIGAVPKVCTLQFRIAAAIFPPRQVRGVMTSLVDRLLNDVELGFEAKASDLLQPLAQQATSDATADYLDALCFLQQKSAALFQLLDDAAKQALVTAAQRAVAQATAVAPTGGSDDEANDDIEGSGNTKKRKNEAAGDSRNEALHGSSFLSRQRDTAAREAASAEARVWDETSATAVRTLFAEFKRDYYERELAWLQSTSEDTITRAFRSLPEALEWRDTALSEASGEDDVDKGGAKQRSGLTASSFSAHHEAHGGSGGGFNITPRVGVKSDILSSFEDVLATALSPALLRGLISACHTTFRRATAIMSSPDPGSSEDRLLGEVLWSAFEYTTHSLSQDMVAVALRAVSQLVIARPMSQPAPSSSSSSSSSSGSSAFNSKSGTPSPTSGMPPKSDSPSVIASMSEAPPASFYACLAAVQQLAVVPLHHLARNTLLPHLQHHPALFAQAQASHAAALHNIERAGVMTTAAGLSAVATVMDRALAKQSLKVEYCPKESSSAASKDASVLGGGGSGSSGEAPSTAKESVSMSRSLFASLAGRSTTTTSSTSTSSTNNSAASSLNKDMDRGVNSAFLAVCAVLRSQIALAAEHLSPPDARGVASALCLRVHGAVAAHVKRLKVSPVGGVWLARDLDELLHCAENALEASFPASSSSSMGAKEGLVANTGSTATAAPMPSLTKQASLSNVGNNNSGGGGASATRVVLGAMAALRDATAVLVVPVSALPKVVEQLADATAACAARVAEFPLSTGDTGSTEEASGSSNGAASEGGGGPESVARLFLLELLKCRADYKDSFGRRAVWVKDMFPDIDGADGH